MYGYQEHGGIVVPNVPLKGYVLIDPDTEKGTRLFEKWQVPDKPSRHVVCYTFVRACIVAGKRIPPSTMKSIRPFFKHQNMPVEIFLHPSLDATASRDIAIDIEVECSLSLRSSRSDSFTVEGRRSD